jgi:hypothetical protein
MEEEVVFSGEAAVDSAFPDIGRFAEGGFVEVAFVEHVFEGCEDGVSFVGTGF